jgi:sec-independent protein translocase protein TatB
VLDFGIDKLALIGAVALIVIGPERLPKVARTVGVLLGKAQRYVSQVQSEVNRSIELEELRKMQSGIKEAAQNVEQSVRNEMNQAESALSSTAQDASSALLDDHAAQNGYSDPYAHTHHTPYYSGYQPPRKNWRLKRNVTPLWYKQRMGVKRHVQSGAARVARFRPPSLSR